jgi:hypothetical protein
LLVSNDVNAKLHLLDDERYRKTIATMEFLLAERAGSGAGSGSGSGW